MTIREYTDYREDEILSLYAAAGWTAYTKDPPALRKGFENSLLVLAAYERNELLGIIRAVGDGHTVVFIQDVLVFPQKRRRGVGTALVRGVLGRYENVRQIELIADDAPELAAFYASLGFAALSDIGCRGYMRR